MSAPNSASRNNAIVDPRKIESLNLDQLVRTVQIIVVALAMGLVMFSGFTLIDLEGFDWQLGALTWMGLGCVVVAIPVSLIVPTSIVSAQIRAALPSGTTEEPAPALVEKLFGFFLVRTIVGCALLEGSGFLNAIAFQMDKNPLSLVAVAVCIVLILAKFPTKWQAQKWIAAQLQG